MISKINGSSIVNWGNTDPTDWRNLPDPEGDNENDEDLPCPQFVIDTLGFDPDELQGL